MLSGRVRDDMAAFVTPFARRQTSSDRNRHQKLRRRGTGAPMSGRVRLALEEGDAGDHTSPDMDQTGDDRGAVAAALRSRRAGPRPAARSRPDGTGHSSQRRVDDGLVRIDGGGHGHRRTSDRCRQARARPGDRGDPGRPSGDQRRLPGVRTQGQQHARREAGELSVVRPDRPGPRCRQGGVERAGRQLHARRMDAHRALPPASGRRLPRRIGHRDQRDHPRHRRSRDLRCRPLCAGQGAQGERRGGHGVCRRSRARRGRAAHHQLHRRQQRRHASSARRTPASCRRRCSRSSRSWRWSSPPGSWRSSRSAGSTRWRR